jgi:hypothetical protein
MGASPTVITIMHKYSGQLHVDYNACRDYAMDAHIANCEGPRACDEARSIGRKGLSREVEVRRLV